MKSSAIVSARTESEMAAEQWESSTCEFLIFRVLRKEHAELRAQVARVRSMAKLVSECERSKHAEFATVRELVDDLAAELAAHMLVEENSLFPALLQLELAYVGEGPVSMPTQSIEPLLRSMSDQHAGTGRMLTLLRRETHDFRPLGGMEPPFLGFYEALAKLDSELRRDLRVEDSILFRRATQIERELLRSGPVLARRLIA